MASSTRVSSSTGISIDAISIPPVLTVVELFITGTLQKCAVISISAGQAEYFTGRGPIVGTGTLGKGAATGCTFAIEAGYQAKRIIFVTGHKKMPMPSDLYWYQAHQVSLRFNGSNDKAVILYGNPDKPGRMKASLHQPISGEFQGRNLVVISFVFSTAIFRLEFDDPCHGSVLPG